MKAFVLILVALMLTGCATGQSAKQEPTQQATVERSTPNTAQPDQAAKPENTAPATPATEQTAASNSADDKTAKAEKLMTNTVQSPLKDFNLVRDEIPPLLVTAKADVYALPSQPSCPTLIDEIKQLDALLGNDLDAKTTEEKPSIVERGVTLVGKEAVRYVSGAINSVIPYRGWVRKLSGAEKHEGEVAAAIAAGTARRSFLKGYSAGMGCSKPSIEVKTEAKT